MAQNNFILDLIAGLQKTRSKQQIKADVKALGDIYVKLIGNLNMTKTMQYIKNQLKGLNNMTFKMTPTVNTNGVQTTVKQSINAAQKVANSNKIHYSFDMDKKKLQNQLKNFANENSKLFSSKEMTAKYNQLLNLANFAKSKSELNALRKQLSAFRTELIATNKAGMTWTDKFKASRSHFAQYFSGASFIYAMTNQLRNAWTEAKTLDDSLVDLQKVTSEIADRDALYKYFDKAMSKAQELNVKVGNLIDAITEFKKLGWSLSDAELGAEWANILSNVGDVDIETAIGSIKTSIASFDEIGGYGNDQLDKKLEAYTDLINNMSNKYSIDAQGLAESIRLSAGTLTEAHTSIEQAATMFATANKYYNDPSYLGNTAKIGSLRMRASTGDTSAIEELQEMGEEVDDLAEATSKLREKLLALTGVDIMVDDHTFKSYYDQLYEISQVIDQLDDTSRANVLETMFGKARAAGGAAILSGMKESATAYQDAINSAGSATQEYETWMQSADAATQRFSNNLIQTYQQFINGNTVRDLANLGSAVLEFANKFGIIEGTLKGFLALKIGTFLTNATMAFLSATKQVEQYGKALQMANNIPNGNLSQRFATLKSIAQATESLSTAQLKQVLSNQALTQSDRVRILMMQGMTKEMALQKLAEMNLTQTINAQTAANAAQTASTFSLKSAMIGLGATIKSVFLSNPIGIALMAISIGVSAVTSAVSSHNQKMDELRQKAKEAANEANTLGDEIADLSSKYIQLSEAVKTDSSAKEDLMSTQTELLKKLGLEGEGIDTLIEKYGSLSEAIKQASIDSLQNARIDLLAGVNAAKEELLDIGKDGFWGGNNIINATGDDAVKAFKELEKAGVVNSGSFGTGGGALVLIGDDTTTEGILENYDRLEKGLAALRDSNAFTAEELSDNSLYQAMYARYSEMTEAVNNYKGAIGDLNENVAQETMLTALQGKEIPKAEKDFETFRQELIDTAVASKQFIGNEKEITDAINNYLSTVPQFEGFYSIPLENELDKVDALLGQDRFSIISNLTNAGLSQDIAQQVVDGFSDADIQAIIDSKDIDWSKMVEGFTEDIVNSDWNEVAKKYGEALAKGKEYSDSLTPSQKKSGNVSNVEDNVLIIGTNTTKEQEEALAKWKAQYPNLQLDQGTARYEKNVVQYRESIDDVRIGAVPTFYTEDGKAEILTPESLSNYLKSVYAEASKMAGGATPENILKVDQNGIKQDINGVTKTVSNMIYAVEGMVVDGVEMTAEDVDKKSKERTNILENSIPKDAIVEVNNMAEQYGTSVNDIVANSNKLNNAAEEVGNNIINSVAKAGTITFDDIFDLQDAENKITPLGKASKKIDEFQNAYKGLKEAMDSYNETGSFTVDQVQSIISYGGEYLKYLMDENGNLQLNEEALDRVAEARINEMRVQAISNLFNALNNINGEIEAQAYLEQQLYETADAYDSLTENKIKDWKATLLEKNISAETADALESSIRKQASAINEMFDNINLDSFHGSVSKSSKDASDSAKEQISSYMEYMKQSLETGRIDYKTYCRDVVNYLNDMYVKGKMSLKEYHDYAKQMFEVQKSVLDGVISAVTKRLDKEIDFLNEKKELIESNYNAKIDAIQSEIDALEEANDKREDQIDLEKKQYELEKARQQKVNALYTADKGKIFTTDSSAIRDAQDEIIQKQHDMKISQLKSQIESLQDAMETETKAIDDQIKVLNRYKEQWSSVADQYEDNQREMYAAGILGNNWQQEVLNGNLDILNNFANEYFDIQRKIQEEAWASAKAQIDAANAVANSTGNTDKKSKKTDDTIEDPLKNKYASNAFGAGKWVRQKYASGTKNAKRGLNLVGEDGIETYIDNDGNVSLVTEPTLIPMEGGEIVKNESETKSLLDGSNLVPLQTSDLFKKLSVNMPDLSSMIKVKTPDYSRLGEVVSKSQIIEQHNQFNISLPNITDNTKATKLFEELQRLPLDALQYSTKRKK